MPLPAPGPDRTAIVTGASSGIGAMIARDLSRRGHHITLVARSADKLEALATELASADGIAMDLADRASRASLLDLVVERGRVPDILVNNAGLSTLGAISKSDPVAEMNMIEVDVMAVADLCSRILPGMVQRGRGAVLNVASMAAFQPVPGQAGYGAGKAFVLSYTQSLAGELRGTAVTATTLCPGPVHTGFGERAGFSTEDAEAALPAVMWVSAEDVAKSAVEGMARGRLVVIPGKVNRAAAIFAQIAPKSMLLPMLVKGHPGLR